MEMYKGWNRQLSLGLFEREEEYNEPIAGGRPLCLMHGFEGEVSWEDKIIDDKSEVTGTEFGLHQEILSYGAKISYKEPHVKPNTLIGLMALTLGAVVSTKDGQSEAYSHRVSPLAPDHILPSIPVEDIFGGLRYRYGGVKGDSIKIAGEAGGTISLDAELLGSGTRTPFSRGVHARKVQESWLKMSQCKLWLASGEAISLRDPLTQWGQDISCDVARSLGGRFKSFEFNWNNKLEGRFGCGTGDGVFRDIDFIRREATFKLTLLFSDLADIDLYERQEVIAIELDAQGEEIYPQGFDCSSPALRYGFHLILPTLRLAKPPQPRGSVGDILTCDLEFTVLDHDAHPVLIFAGQNKEPSYLQKPKGDQIEIKE
jgi:hypothetical protein